MARTSGECFFFIAVLVMVVVTQPSGDEDADGDVEISPPNAGGSTSKITEDTLDTTRKASCQCLDELQGDPEEPACTCDVLDVYLDESLPRLGLDRCVTFGTCEACLQEELGNGYCARTKRKQRVVCSRCHAPGLMIPRSCSPSVSPFWEAETLKSVANVSVDGEHLFYRSCDAVDGDNGEEEEQREGDVASDTSDAEQWEGDVASDTSSALHASPSPPRRGPLLSWHSLTDEEDDEKVAERKSRDHSAPARRGPLLRGAINATHGTHRVSHTPEAVRDESAEVLCFAALNAIAFGISFLSLRRQQRAIMQKTLGVLFDDPVISKDENLSLSTAQHLNVTLEPASAMPDSIGRSIEAVATAVARTGNAIERAVTEELTKASLATSKKN